MAARYILTATPQELQSVFDYRDGAWFPPRYNIAPTQPIAVVRMDRGERSYALVRWGLIPAWVKDPRPFPLLVNARAEQIADKPAFRGALRYRRCLVPATGFFVWQEGARRQRQPWLIRPRGGGVIAFAGLWESWLGADGSELDTACIVTARADGSVAGAARLPVILEPDDFAPWLDAESVPPAVAVDLLVPPLPGGLGAVAVSGRVNNPANEGPDLIEPLPAPGA